MTDILKTQIDRFDTGRDLSGADAEPLLDALIGASDEQLLSDVFNAWNRKGIGEEEIFHIAAIMRRRCMRIEGNRDGLVDIVGTGGSSSKRFNVSTAAAFVVAGSGIPVAKHGNRAATSSSGSADVLAALGVEPAMDPTIAERCLRDFGICFMFAPNFHRLSPTLAKVRRGLGFPTIFNCVGPLSNPASATHQLIGVWSREMVPKMASALSRLETGRSWIVHGEGLDEISLDAPTYVCEVRGSAVKRFEISPADFGIGHAAPDDIRAVSPMESAEVIRHVLGHRSPGSSAERLVLMNAAAAIHLWGRGKSLADSYAVAEESLSGGAAMAKLELLANAVKA